MGTKADIVKAFAKENGLEVVDIPISRNQCDGCQAGHELAKSRFSTTEHHIDPETGYVYMVCQRERYI